MTSKYQEDIDKMEAMLDISSSRVQQNVSIITPDDIRELIKHPSNTGDVMLHISTNPDIRKFIPQLTLRGAPDENRDITRVYVAPTLLGCMIGYAKISHDHMNLVPDGKADNEKFKGGWKIYALPFKAALRPTPKMVKDQKASDEIWLVTYSDETRDYVPETAGFFFIESITYWSRNKKLPYAYLSFFVEVKKEEGLAFSKNHWLEKGYYRIEGPDQTHVESWQADEDFQITKVSKGEYESVKRKSADLLSHVDIPNKPGFVSWK